MGLGEIEWQGSALILRTFRSSELIGQLSSASAASKRQSRQQPICFVAIYIYIYWRNWGISKSCCRIVVRDSRPSLTSCQKKSSSTTSPFRALSVLTSVSHQTQCMTPSHTTELTNNQQFGPQPYSLCVQLQEVALQDRVGPIPRDRASCEESWREGHQVQAQWVRLPCLHTLADVMNEVLIAILGTRSLSFTTNRRAS